MGNGWFGIVWVAVVRVEIVRVGCVQVRIVRVGYVQVGMVRFGSCPGDGWELFNVGLFGLRRISYGGISS